MNRKLKELLYDIKGMARDQIPMPLNDLRAAVDGCGYYTALDIDPNNINHRFEIFTRNKHIATLKVDIINNRDVVVTGCRYVRDMPELNYQIDANGKLSYFQSIVL